MKRFCSKLLFILGAFSACLMMVFSSGCASGGYKLTRSYSRWVNSQNIILRIIIYLLTGVVYAVTILIDLVIFNTIDFWEGKISQGTFEIKEEDKVYHVKHEILPGSNLKRSTIEVRDESQKLLQVVVLNETISGEIELTVDGQLRTRVKDITGIPVAAMYDAGGKSLGEKILWFTSSEKVVAQQ